MPEFSVLDQIASPAGDFRNFIPMKPGLFTNGGPKISLGNVQFGSRKSALYATIMSNGRTAVP